MRALCILLSCLLASLATAAEEQPRFEIQEYRVLGNTVLPPLDLERVLYPRLGADKTLEDVEQARAAVERLYRDRGFGVVYVDIPEQSVDEGIVRLKVTEGRLDRVRVTGARFFSARDLRAELPALDGDQVLELPAFQSQLGVANQRSRDRIVTPVLKPGARPGAVDVELKVQDTLPIHGSVEVNDRYSANTTRTRASLTVSYDNLFQDYQSLSFTYQASPQRLDDSRVLSASWVSPLGSPGNALALYAVDTNSDFAVVSNDLSVLGKGRIYGARYVKRLPSTGGFFQGATFGGDLKDFSDNIRLPGDVQDTTPIRYAVWSAAYSGGINTGDTTTTFGLGVNAGIRGLFNQSQEFAYKRFRANPGFFALRGDLAHERPLLLGSTVHARATGQWTAAPLISNEQFGIGGGDSVRGYLESAQLGDRGWMGSLELRSPSLGGLVGTPSSRLNLFGFVDAGFVSVLQFIQSTRIGDEVVNEVQASKGYQLASAGAGIRFAGLGGLDAALDVAWPLEDSPNTRQGDARLHFRVRYGF